MKARTPQQIRDELLVLRCQAGERDALAALVERWQGPFWRHACNVTGRQDAAWDVVQDAWTAIVSGIRRLDDEAAFPRWAFRIVHRRAADWLRREGRARRAAEAAALAPPADPPEAEGRLSALRAALGRLDPERRALLDLYYAQQLAVAEVAGVLGVPAGTVKSRLYHARQELKRIMEEDEDNGQ